MVAEISLEREDISILERSFPRDAQMICRCATDFDGIAEITPCNFEG